MKLHEIYEKYPAWIVLVVNVLQLITCVAGAYVLFRLNFITGILFVIYLVMVEFGVYREGCRRCCYYGGGCAFGKGAIAKVFYKKGDPKKFCERELKWKDFIPQILIVAIPVVIGILLLISRGFDVWILISVIYLALSWFMINPIIYGKLACVHCKQGKKCCPAMEFFRKKEKK